LALASPDVEEGEPLGDAVRRADGIGVLVLYVYEPVGEQPLDQRLGRGLSGGSAPLRVVVRKGV
jgi:hypothetical protein